MNKQTFRLPRFAFAFYAFPFLRLMHYVSMIIFVLFCCGDHRRGLHVFVYFIFSPSVVVMLRLGPNLLSDEDPRSNVWASAHSRHIADALIIPRIMLSES